MRTWKQRPAGKSGPVIRVKPTTSSIPRFAEASDLDPESPCGSCYPHLVGRHDYFELGDIYTRCMERGCRCIAPTVYVAPVEPEPAIEVSELRHEFSPGDILAPGSVWSREEVTAAIRAKGARPVRGQRRSAKARRIMDTVGANLDLSTAELIEKLLR